MWLARRDILSAAYCELEAVFAELAGEDTDLLSLFAGTLCPHGAGSSTSCLPG
jgi:hypothetical protein